MSLERLERPLTDSEKAGLQARLRSVEAARSSHLIKSGAASAVICALLCAFTLAASDAPRAVILLFWGVMTLGLTFWVGMSERRDTDRQGAVIRDCLRANRARVLRARSERVVEFEEIEDEGACYGFQVSIDEILIVQGQEFYADEQFPNSDFSLVELLTSSGKAGDFILEKHGKRIQPERQIEASVKDGLAIPDHLSVVRGDISGIERLLSTDLGR